MSRDYEEKRRFPRVRLNCTATFKDLETGESFTQMALDLSGGGVLFLCDRPLSRGALLEIRVDPGTGLTPPLRARIRVHRVEARDRGDYKVAATIDEVLSEEAAGG